MVGMGYNLEEIQESLAKMKYDEITATYLLLGRKASEVQTTSLSLLLEITVSKYYMHNNVNVCPSVCFSDPCLCMSICLCLFVLSGCPSPVGAR